MFCYKCGGEIGSGAHFCRSCGTKVNHGNDVLLLNAIAETGNENYTAVAKTQSVWEVLDTIANVITGILSAISMLVLFGALLGYFDNSPVPFLVFIGVVVLFEWLYDKLPKVPKIVFAVLEIITLIICFSIVGSATAVNSVKTGSPFAYPNITYEKAFDYYFADPTWKSAGEDKEGNKIVKFTGYCYYWGEKVHTEVKFTVYDEYFEVSSVRVNGMDIGWLGNAFVIDAFEEYEQRH